MKIHNYINYAQQTTKYTYEICFGSIASVDREKLKKKTKLKTMKTYSFSSNSWVERGTK